MTTTRDITYRPDGTGCTWDELLAAFKVGRRATIASDTWTITGELWHAGGWGVGPTCLPMTATIAATITVHDVPAPHWADDEPLVVTAGRTYYLRQPDGTYALGPNASRWTPAQLDAAQWDVIPVIDRHGRWVAEQ